jgi:3-deoxy-7-phosphoheptulonate synthase
LIVEVHSNPSEAFSDGGQSLKPERFAEMVTQVRAIALAVGRKLAPVHEPMVGRVA